MAKDTTIQWCDSTVNPTLGCDGCELWNGSEHSCYAGTLTKRFGASNPGLANNFDVVELARGRVGVAAKWKELTDTQRKGKPWLYGLPRLIFLGDMADTFSSDVPLTYLRDEVIEPVASEEGQRHQWLWLTKRPGRMRKFSTWLAKQSIAWPTNLWAGTSITTQARTTRIRDLLHVGDERTIHFVSVEPQWEAIELRRWLPALDWVIQGGHSGSHDHPFAMEWAYDLLGQCREHHVPYFLKQLGSCVTVGGEKLRGHRGQGGDLSNWPSRLRVRQFPVYFGRRHSRSVVQRKLVHAL